MTSLGLSLVRCNTRTKWSLPPRATEGGNEQSACSAQWPAHSTCSLNAAFAKDADEPRPQLTAQIRTVPHPDTAPLVTPQSYRDLQHPLFTPPTLEGGVGGSKEKETEGRETKASSIFKAAASLRRGPGWRCKPTRLIETKLQVQREVIRKPPSGSMLPFKFHLIKPKEKKPLCLLSPPAERPSALHMNSLCSLRSPTPCCLPSFLLSRGGGKDTPTPVMCLPTDQGAPNCPPYTSHPTPAQKTTGGPSRHGAGHRWEVKLGTILPWGPGGQE